MKRKQIQIDVSISWDQATDLMHDPVDAEHTPEMWAAQAFDETIALNHEQIEARNAFDEAIQKRDVQSFQSDSGRGIQISKGVEKTTREIVVIVHADLTLDSTILPRIESTMMNSSITGGATEQKFDSRSITLKAIQFLNTVRAKLFGISFTLRDHIQLRKEQITKSRKIAFQR